MPSAARGTVRAVTMRLTSDSLGAVTDLPAPALLVGLHTCGDLGPTLLRAFVHSDARALVSVGCCYHYLTENGPEPGFPLSNAARGLGLGASPSAREMAMHAAEAWAQQPTEQHRCHAYRALLEVLLAAQPGHRVEGARIGRMRLQQPRRGPGDESFAEYAQARLARLGIQLPDEQLRAVHAGMPHPEPAYAMLFALRTLVARVVETAILLDRVAYLHEALGADAIVGVMPLFDPVLSPRNFAIYACRRHMESAE